MEKLAFSYEIPMKTDTCRSIPAMHHPIFRSGKSLAISRLGGLGGLRPPDILKQQMLQIIKEKAVPPFEAPGFGAEPRQIVSTE